MAYDLLTTSGINSLINYYVNNESQKRIAPLQTRKTKYTSISNIYTNLLSKVDALKSKMSILKATGTSSAFADKLATSSNKTAVTVSANTAAQNGAFALRVNQLAKNDLVISLDNNSTDLSSITTPGNYSFAINSGDGQGGQFVSNVSVELTSADFTNGHISFENLANKVSLAINQDRAVVTSNSLSGSTSSSGSFTFNLNGTETTIDYSAGTYDEVIDSIITQLQDISGVTAEKVVNGSNVQLKLTVTDSSKYITINGDTGSLVSELGIAVEQEKGASGIVSANTFSPSSGLTQISLTAKNSGSGFKIENLSDLSGGILSEFGLNLGSTRTAFVQNESGSDTAGFVYDNSLLNSKILFNGISIERNTNTISDLVTGVSINLKSVMAVSDNDVTVDVANDVESVKSKIQDFITTFNDIYSYIKTNTQSTDGTRGVLLGDSSASSLLTMLSSAAYTPVSGLGSGTINSLSEMGITFNINTGLTITNADQLNNALQNNITEVEQTFNSDSGIAVGLYNKLLPYTGFAGYLANRKSSYDDNIQSISDSITKIQTKIDKDSVSLRDRYVQLQSQLSELLSSNGVFDQNLFS